MGISQRHRQRARFRGRHRARGRPAWSRNGACSVESRLRDPPAAAHTRGRGHRRGVVAGACRGGRRATPGAGHRRHGLPRGARRGRRPAVPHRGPLRRFRRRSAALGRARVGAGSGALGHRGRPAAAGNPAAQRRLGAQARGVAARGGGGRRHRAGSDRGARRRRDLRRGSPDRAEDRRVSGPAHEPPADGRVGARQRAGRLHVPRALCAPHGARRVKRVRGRLECAGARSGTWQRRPERLWQCRVAGGERVRRAARPAVVG